MTSDSLSIPQNTAASARKPEATPRRFPKGLLLFILIAGAAAWFFLAGHGKQSTPAATTGDQVVAVAKAARQDLSQGVTLTAEFLPYQNVSVHAKVAGYVKSISVDIGDHVKAGQTLAVLEIPELNDDVKKAFAELMTAQEEVKRAQANYEDVHLATQRLMEVAKANPKLVAVQDVDTAKSKDDALASALSAAQKRVDESQANVGKMQTLLGYSSITAPFDGVITKRYADTGALVQAGTASETQAMPVVDIAEDHVLRLIFPAPESAVSAVHDGLPVEITVSSLHETFAGKVTRFAGKVDFSTRTMRTEVDIPNPQGKYTPGMYATVKVPLEQRKNVLAVPLQALSAGDNPTVLVLNKENELEEKKVTVGLQTSTMAEISSGLEENEMVVIGSRANLHPGEKVSGKMVDLALNEGGSAQ
jgi:RND family efflux transporter MFP subunit